MKKKLIAKYRMQNTKKLQNANIAKYKIKNTKHKLQNAKCRWGNMQAVHRPVVASHD